mgnify:CR=1 FL=1
MNLIMLLVRHSLKTFSSIVASGLVSGLASAGLLVVINHVLMTAAGAATIALVGFLGLVTLWITARPMYSITAVQDSRDRVDADLI